MINNLLTTFGNDVIINGLEVTNLTYDAGTETINFTLNPGKIVIDTTLIEYSTPSNLSINVSGYDSSGLLLVLVSFRYSETLHENLSKFKILYLDSTARYTYPTQIERSTDRIILATLTFDKNLNTVSLVTNPDPRVSQTITVNSEVIEVYPLTNIIRASRTFVINLFN
jgi:hypothetical protein